MLSDHAGGGCPDAAAVLDAHNTYRAWHGAAALQWDEDLAEEAQEFAQELARGGCLIRHDKDAYEEFGENVYGTGGFPAPDRSCKVAADVWYGVSGGGRGCRGKALAAAGGGVEGPMVK